VVQLLQKMCLSDCCEWNSLTLLQDSSALDVHSHSALRLMCSIRERASHSCLLGALLFDGLHGDVLSFCVLAQKHLPKCAFTASMQNFVSWRNAFHAWLWDGHLASFWLARHRIQFGEYQQAEYRFLTWMYPLPCLQIAQTLVFGNCPNSSFSAPVPGINLDV
jgi:hypothetical protein